VGLVAQWPQRRGALSTTEVRLLREWSHDEDELFERHAKTVLRDQKTSDWKYADILWQGLQIVSLATAKRIIAHAIFLCAQRGEAPPSKAGDAAVWLLVGERSRFRVHDPVKFNAAKSYAELHPLASLREIADASGVHYTSIRDWKKQNFELERNDLGARTMLLTTYDIADGSGHLLVLEIGRGRSFAFLPSSHLPRTLCLKDDELATVMYSLLAFQNCPHGKKNISSPMPSASAPDVVRYPPLNWR
jgi:hypothetical protein